MKGLSAGSKELNRTEAALNAKYTIPHKYLSPNTVYAKLSPVSTRGHQSELGHMIERGK